MATRASRRSSSKAITYVVVKDFRGGITAQNDKVQIPIGSTPMARNVEWRQTGGFYVRKGVGALTYGAANAELVPPGVVPIAFYHYVKDPTAVTAFTSQFLVAGDDGSVRVGVDKGPDLGIPAGTWLTLQVAGVPFATAGRPTFTAWDQNLYITVGDIETTPTAMHRWDGATATALGTAFVNDYAAPTGGNMIPARYAAAWQERMWLGATFDSGGDLEPSRIRWSHPGRPEDYAEDDYIDVGEQGEVITGIAPMRDMLVVFKRSSTYALLGSGASNFRVVDVSALIGCTGEFTRDNQGAVVFWDGTIGLCRFDGKGVVNLFEPLLGFLQPGPAASITRCGAVVSDGEKVYVATDFTDFYGSRVMDPGLLARSHNRAGDWGPIIPGETTWADLTSSGVTWAGTAGSRWLRAATQFYNLVWVYRVGAGWTSYSLLHPEALNVTMMGELRSRLNAAGDVVSNRRVVYGLQDADTPIYMSDRYDNGRDWWTQDDQRAIDSFYMTPWLHGGLPAQVKRWKAPRIIQEADEPGVLLADVFYDFNYDFLRRTLRTAVVEPLSFDSYLVGKPGTIGRAKAVMLVIRPEEPRHWGVASITIPVHPKVMR